jgi:hypothetical protein
LIGMVSAPQWRAIALACIVTACGLSAACSSNNSGSGLSSNVGTGSGITISTATGTVLVQEGTTLQLTATVANDTSNAGVTWTLSGLGSLSGATTGEVTYNAPAVGTVTGTTTPVITATSVTDTTKSSAVSLLVAGTPVIDPMTLFPANANTPWGATIVVVGGQAPFAWTLNSGTLPPGVTLGSTTSSNASLSGTPTATGTFDFQIKVTDTQNRTATVDLSLLVTPQAACLLNGRFALLYTGFSTQKLQTRAASFSVAADGTVTGIMDTRTASGAVGSETLTGTCTTRTGNNGTLTLTGSTSGQLAFDYAVRASLGQGRVQLTSGAGDASGTGLIAHQDATAFALAQLPTTAAFGLIGADTNDVSMGLAGRLDRDTTGTVTSGRADSNGTPALEAAAISGSMSQPDATSGRGTLNLTIGGTSYQFVYYVVDASRLMLVNMDTAAQAQRLAGFLTARAASFDATSLAAPGILSLWGAASGSEPVTVLSLGRLSNASAGAGTLDLSLDTADRATALAGVAISGATYAVESDGRATLGFTSGSSTRSFALYLDGTANGYVVEKNSVTGNAGLLEAQAAAPFSNVLPGLFVFGTQYAQSPGPMTLAPLINFSGGVMSGNYVSGYYALDTATGHGVGTLSITGIGATSMSMYVVRPDRVVVLQFATSIHDATLNWVEK